MVDINDLYCSIFTDAAVKIEVLINKVAELTTGNVEFRSVTSTACLIGIAKNDEYDPIRLLNPADGFLFSRFKLETDPNINESNAY
ncbi:hypothetical protein [Paenibacillus glycanilyticus]|uniref:hypothetical protein n=1 Tax=Paenibacillus glycanilyticus TaxID=126569 RepID=UPI003EB943B9